MDETTLQSILSVDPLPTFWIKPVGIPEEEPDIRIRYTNPNYSVEFSHEPDEIGIGDILIVYRIGISKVIYIAESMSRCRAVTSLEVTKNPWKERWPWTIQVRNLTPTYGAHWATKNIKPFSLVKNYNRFSPEDAQNLGSLQYGADKLRISSDFGIFLLHQIMRLPELF